MSQYLIVALALILGIQLGSATEADISDVNCPVQYHGECFKMFTSPTAFTRVSGDQLCHDLDIVGLGISGHLANVYDKDHFDALIQYILKEAPNSDPNVLLGMTWDKDSKSTISYDGKDMENSYWGLRARPLSWGVNMCIRASKIVSSSKLQNIGDDTTRYRRVMCQFSRK